MAAGLLDTVYILHTVQYSVCTFQYSYPEPVDSYKVERIGIDLISQVSRELDISY